MAGGMGRDVRILEMFRQARDRVWRTLLAGEDTPPVVNDTLVSPHTFRQNIELEALVMMKQLYEEKKRGEIIQAEEKSGSSVYSSEVIEMMRHLMRGPVNICNTPDVIYL